jgi:hypothetical protein
VRLITRLIGPVRLTTYLLVTSAYDTFFFGCPCSVFESGLGDSGPSALSLERVEPRNDTMAEVMV